MDTNDQQIMVFLSSEQIDDLKIQNALRKDDKFTAAKLAIKILVEDEYIIDTVIMVRSFIFLTNAASAEKALVRNNMVTHMLLLYSLVLHCTSGS